MRQAQEERKAQLASKNQLEAKYALKFKLKKDKLDRRRRRLVEREEKVVEVETALQASRQRVRRQRSTASSWPASCLTTPSNVHAIIQVFHMQDRIETQIQATERKQLDLVRREAALADHKAGVDEVAAAFTEREEKLQSEKLRVQDLTEELVRKRYVSSRPPWVQTEH